MNDEWLFYRGNTINFLVPEGVTGPIHTIGDSHVNVMDQVFPDMFISTRFAKLNVISSRQALYTAYSAGRPDQNDYILPALSHIPEGAKILTMFGEIDCREYIPELAKEENQSIEYLISLVIEGYTKNFLDVVKTKYRVMVVSPYVNPQDTMYRHKYEDIFEAKLLYCEYLKRYCKEGGLLFIDMFHESLKNKWDSFPLGTYFNDSTHLGPCMIPVILNALKNFKWKGFDI